VTEAFHIKERRFLQLQKAPQCRLLPLVPALRPLPAAVFPARPVPVPVVSEAVPAVPAVAAVRKFDVAKKL
jgi:hypothetical protein